MNQTENNELKQFNTSSDSEFKVPDGYFENLKFEIDRKIVTSRPIIHRSHNRWIYATAASIVLLLGSAIYYISTKEFSPVEKGIQLTNIVMDSSIHSDESHLEPNILYHNVAKTTLSPENQDIIDDELIATADELNLTDEELVELTEYIDL